MKKIFTRGFTLIELLVVIAIIGILATIITASLSTAKAKGRDARRISDIKTIQTALEMYYNDNYKYPTTISGLVPNYLPVKPTDPSTGADYKYSVFGASAGLCTSTNPPIKYHLGATLEQTSNSVLTQDSDLPYNGNTCTGTTADFDGTSVGCVQPAGTAQPGGTETCYDVTN